MTPLDKGSQFPPDNPSESLYEKESREADEILAKERAAREKDQEQSEIHPTQKP
jgi:hypothetical protein